MKWNILLGLAAAVSVYLTLAVGVYFRMKSEGLQNSAPPSAGFFFAIPYGVVVFFLVFVACWVLQRMGLKI